MANMCAIMLALVISSAWLRTFHLVGSPSSTMEGSARGSGRLARWYCSTLGVEGCSPCRACILPLSAQESI